jgi:uncharacterized sulfatase
MDLLPPHFRKTQEEHPDFSEYQEEGGNGLHGFHSHLYPESEMRKDLACYYGMTSLLDREVGRILEALDRLGLSDNTLVVFTTDHGHFLGEHGLFAKGAFHYEELVRVPMLARLPSRIPAGRVSRSLQSLVDYPVVFLRAAGLPVPGRMQGRDLWENWCGDESPAKTRRHVLVENRHNPTRLHLKTLITERYKLTVYRGQPYGELFDLEADPKETRNLWDDPAQASLKCRLLHQFAQADLEAEGTPMPRIAGA